MVIGCSIAFLALGARRTHDRTLRCFPARCCLDYESVVAYAHMSTTACTPAPPSPPNGPSDWTLTVQGNCFSNIQRLGRWTGGTTVVPSRTDPSRHFQSVAPGSLAGGANPPTIYVLAHGWAPGYRAAVNAQGGNLLWWGPNASANCIWTSDWAWSPVSAPLTPPFTVNTTGVLQSIAAFDPNAVILAYSWIDDSATDSGDLNLDEVYGSEAYTHVNGIRLANALEQAIASSFWNAPSGLLRIIGHSHGSKVATVAALTLQHRGRRVAHLTICDAPESELTLEANGSNLLGFYLEQMQIANPSCDCAGGAFVDNYASYFGVSYAGTPNLGNIVEVALDPSKLYDFDDPGNRHSYAAAWYGARREWRSVTGRTSARTRLAAAAGDLSACAQPEVAHGNRPAEPVEAHSRQLNPRHLLLQHAATERDYHLYTR